jgi:hypothetical protein
MDSDYLLFELSSATHNIEMLKAKYRFQAKRISFLKSKLRINDNTTPTTPPPCIDENSPPKEIFSSPDKADSSYINWVSADSASSANSACKQSPCSLASDMDANLLPPNFISTEMEENKISNDPSNTTKKKKTKVTGKTAGYKAYFKNEMDKIKAKPPYAKNISSKILKSWKALSEEGLLWWKKYEATHDPMDYMLNSGPYSLEKSEKGKDIAADVPKLVTVNIDCFMRKENKEARACSPSSYPKLSNTALSTKINQSSPKHLNNALSNGNGLFE